MGAGTRLTSPKPYSAHLTAKLIIRETLARVGGEMCGNLGHEVHSKFLQLPLTHSVDAAELRPVNRIVMGHLAQCDVRKDNVRRQPSFVGKFLAQPAQPIEQRFVTDNLARGTLTWSGCAHRRLWPGYGFGKPQGLSLLERGLPFVSQSQHIEFFSLLPQVTEPDQLAANHLPFAAAAILADAVGRESLVVPLQHIFRLGAGKHFDNLINAEIEPGFFSNT